jgi:hypothetical protein
MSEVNMVDVDSRALAAFLVARSQVNHVNRTTIRPAVKATRSHGSTVVVRMDTSIIRTPGPCETVWDSHNWTAGLLIGSSTQRDVAGRMPSNTVRPGGQLRLSDCHK